MQAIIEKSHDGDSRFTSRKPKRAGDDGSPVLFRERKITPELEAEPRVRTVFPESKCPRPFPPLTETHMSVCSNRWLKALFRPVLIGTGLFYFFITTALQAKNLEDVQFEFHFQFQHPSHSMLQYISDNDLVFP